MWNGTPTDTLAGYARSLCSALAALGCAAGVAACGTSGALSTPQASNGYSPALKFSDCMRSHGVPDFPDPGQGGIQFAPGAGVDPSSPAFQTAQSACAKLLGNAGPAGFGHPSEQAKALMLATSKCMRSHGVTGFPDPTTTPPSSPSGYSDVIGRGGVFIAVPETISTSSPAYRHAAVACKFGPPAGATKASAL